MLRGREPRALHPALALILRYTFRAECFFLLVTPLQPLRGLLGDEEVAVAPTLEVTSGPSTVWRVTRSAWVVVVVAILLRVPAYALQVSWERAALSPFRAFLSRMVIESSHNSLSVALNRRGCATREISRRWRQWPSRSNGPNPCRRSRRFSPESCDQKIERIERDFTSLDQVLKR